MRKLLNSLYVTKEDAYLTTEDENIVVNVGTAKIAKIPLHTLESIICFSYPGASPSLVKKCIEKNIGISFFSPNGRFCYRAQGIEHGNVLVRQEQYRIADDENRSVGYAKNMIDYWQSV